VGVAIATSGPGTTNMVTGIATAFLDSSPLVCLTGQVSTSLLGYDAFQEVDTTGITMPITKHNYLVSSVDELGSILREAFHIARSGRPGPVLVDIPKDVQNAVTDWDGEYTPVNLPGYHNPAPVSSQDLEVCETLIQTSQRPVILAGRGVILGGAAEELKVFSEKCQIPVATTLLGIDAFPAEHPHYLGMMGLHGESWVNQAIQRSDLIIALGMRFDDRATGRLETFAPHARKIHVDIDRTEIDKNVYADAGIVAELKPWLAAITALMPEQEHIDWLAKITADRQSAAGNDFVHLPDDGILYGIHVIHDLWQLAAEDAIVVADVGQHQMWAAQYFKFQHPSTFITSGGLGTMGFALPAAIGAKLAQPEHEVWVIVGDGGFQMTQAELSTLKQENLKINIAVINNGFLGMVRQLQDVYCQSRHSGVNISAPDFTQIAWAHGLKGQKVTKRSEIEKAVRAAQGSAQAALIDFQVAREEMVYPMVPAGASLDQMIRRSKTG
jgi:acetolactate synthase-1/2/3 large subunit